MTSPGPSSSFGRQSPSSQFPSSSQLATYTPEDCAQALKTTLTHGLLNPQEARVRRQIYGLNELPQPEQEPIWLKFAKQFIESRLILLLLGSAALSFFMGNMDDAISITIAVIIVVTVGFVQEHRSEKSLEALNKLVPHHAHLIRGRDPRQLQASMSLEEEADILATAPTSTTVAASQLVPGDLIAFTTGDRIPADIRICSSSELEIDESNLTGETDPVRKDNQPIQPPETSSSPLYSKNEVPIPDMTCVAFQGTLVRNGHGQGLVVATGGLTEFGKINAMLSELSSPRTPLQVSMDKLGNELSMASFVVIGLIVLVGIWQGRSWLDMFQIAVSLAVAAIPEGLPIIVTVTLALGVLRMVRRGAIVKKLPKVETLGCVNVVCSDKTGTLTMNHMTVTTLWTPDLPAPVKKESLQSRDVTLDSPTMTLLRIGNLCNNGRLASTHAIAVSQAHSVHSPTGGQQSRFVGQPTDVAMLDLLDAFAEEDVRSRGTRSGEVPFSSTRKWMGVTMEGTGHKTAYMKGALERVLARCDTYLSRDGKTIVLDEPRRAKAMAAAETMAEEGLRVIGFASGQAAKMKNDDLETTFNGLTFAGIVGMYDPPRRGVKKAIERLMMGGVKVIMITGDAETTAVAIAKKLGMPVLPSTAIQSKANLDKSSNLPSSNGHAIVGHHSRSVIRGEELDNMSDEELSHAISSTTIFARASPEHKMKIIRALQAPPNEAVVAMTGDGVNDAPALKLADIGISMGILGTDVAKEAASMILTDDDFGTILKAIEEGKGIFYNIQNFLTFQLSTSVAALSLVLVSTFWGVQNPLNPMQILWINILMDGPPAQSLGVEPVDPAVMTAKPRSRHARILTPLLLQRVFTSAFLILIGTMAIYIHEMVDGDINARDTTMTFTAFVLFDMFNALTCRSAGKSVLRGEVKLFGNRMFNIAVGGSLMGQLGVVYLPFLQRVFQTEGLYFADWCLLIVVASSVFWADEGRKYWAYRKLRRSYTGYSRIV